jgi:hypothetical protein
VDDQSVEDYQLITPIYNGREDDEIEQLLGESVFYSFEADNTLSFIGLKDGKLFHVSVKP